MQLSISQFRKALQNDGFFVFPSFFQPSLVYSQLYGSGILYEAVFETLRKYWNKNAKGFGVIENSGNYILFCPESSRIPQEFLSAVKNTNVFEVSKGQFGEGSDRYN